MRILWFCEYYNSGSGHPVNLSIGLHSKEAAIHRGKVVVKVNGYLAFWILRKQEGSTKMPVRVEYHQCSRDPRGVISWLPVVKA